MTRSRCFSLCACLALSLTAIACGSSNSGGGGTATWDKVRMGDTGMDWLFSAVKGADYVFLDISYPNNANDPTMKADAIAFAQHVLGKYKAGAAPVSMVPTSGEVAGWTYNQDPTFSKSSNGPGVATDSTSAEFLIDGGAAAFFSGSYQASGLAWENYINGNYWLELQVWQMKSAADASQVYGDLLTTSALYSNATWTTCTGTDPANPCP